MTDFWRSCGYSRLGRDPRGRLVVTDDFLRRYLDRPELSPIDSSCDNERRLHAALQASPRLSVPDPSLNAIVDADARDNYRVLLRFRDQLIAAPSLEGFYAGLFRRDVSVPPAFVDEIVQAILRGMLEGCDDGVTLRAAELFFRRQQATVVDGAIMLADGETVQRHALDGGFGHIGALLKAQRTALRTVDLDVLKPDNAQLYFLRDERFDFALQLNSTHPGCAAFCRLIERWIGHFHDTPTTVQPVREIPDDEWVWHIGLDAQASAILNDLYRGTEVDEPRLRRIVGLFRLEFAEAAHMRAEIRGRPLFLGLAMSDTGEVRMKPQNLLVNLPLAHCA